MASLLLASQLLPPGSPTVLDWAYLEAAHHTFFISIDALVLFLVDYDPFTKSTLEYEWALMSVPLIFEKNIIKNKQLLY